MFVKANKMNTTGLKYNLFQCYNHVVIHYMNPTKQKEAIHTTGNSILRY